MDKRNFACHHHHCSFPVRTLKSSFRYFQANNFSNSRSGEGRGIKISPWYFDPLNY